jgi:hypothetical protein
VSIENVRIDSAGIARSLRRASVVLGLAVLVSVVILALGGVGGARGDETKGEAAQLVMRQITALRARDFAAAYALVSRELRRHFSRSEFEWMVKRAHPEVASSTRAFVVRTHEAGGYLYVTVKIQGTNGKNVEALYEVVREGGVLKVNALSSRRDEGVL